MSNAVDTNQTLRELSELIRTHDSNVAKADAKASADNDRFEAEIQQRLAAINPKGSKGALKFALSLFEWTAIAIFVGGLGCSMIYLFAIPVSIFWPPELNQLPIEPKYIVAAGLFVCVVYVTDVGSRFFYKLRLLRIQHGIGRREDVVQVVDFESGTNKHPFALLPHFIIACAALAYAAFQF